MHIHGIPLDADESLQLGLRHSPLPVRDFETISRERHIEVLTREGYNWATWQSFSRERNRFDVVRKSNCMGHTFLGHMLTLSTPHSVVGNELHNDGFLLTTHVISFFFVPLRLFVAVVREVSASWWWLNNQTQWQISSLNQSRSACGLWYCR